MQRSAFESFHPWVIFGYLAAVLAVTMSTMHPVMIVTSFVISLVYSLFSGVFRLLVPVHGAAAGFRLVPDLVSVPLPTSWGRNGRNRNHRRVR